jgi:iron complex transport system substrate-binding protein
MVFLSVLRRTVIGLVALSFVLGLGAPWAAAQEGEGPRTVNDFMGRPITIEAPPQRVVGMSASINEMLFALGVTPVGVTDGMDFPPAAADLPTFGTGYQPDLEALAALEPDLIIANGQLNMQFMDQLEAIAPTVAIMILTADDVVANMRLLGQATWHDTQAEYLAKSYEDMLALGDAVGAAQTGPSILIVVGTLEVPNYGKSETYLGNMAARLGATNIADGNEDAGPFPGYAQLSIEAILDADPDVIFTITRGADTPMAESMAADPVWSSLSAVANGHVYELDNRLFLESPGPRFTDGLVMLYNIFYGGE